MYKSNNAALLEIKFKNYNFKKESDNRKISVSIPDFIFYLKKQFFIKRYKNVDFFDLFI